MPPDTDDLRIRSFAPLSAPAELLREFPCSEPMSDNVVNARRALHRILHGEDDRLAVVIGPCSIHDPHAAMEYAARLRPLRDTLGDALELIMRVYFEKPRTTVGWKGLINDPDLDGSFNITRVCGSRALALRNQRARFAGRRGIPRHDLTAVHLRSRGLGRHRRTHH
jgi:3-deoxy-7-phosphoheptulonate synthase